MKSLASRSNNNNNKNYNNDRDKNIALIFAMACSCRYIYTYRNVSHRCTPNIFGYQRFSAFSICYMRLAHVLQLWTELRRSRRCKLQLQLHSPRTHKKEKLQQESATKRYKVNFVCLRLALSYVYVSLCMFVFVFVCLFATAIKLKPVLFFKHMSGRVASPSFVACNTDIDTDTDTGTASLLLLLLLLLHLMHFSVDAFFMKIFREIITFVHSVRNDLAMCAALRPALKSVSQVIVFIRYSSTTSVRYFAWAF